jgi:Tfp pilus assembly protein PilF
MLRRWLRGCLLPSALWLTASGCTPSVESLTGGLVTTWGSAPAENAEAARPRAAGELSVDEQLRLHLDTARQMDKGANDEGALDAYERILQLDPANYTAQRRLCVLYDRQAAWDKAEAMYRKVAKIRPNDPDVWSDWGYSYFLRAGDKNWAEAEGKLRQALKINPQHARAHANLGLVLGELKRYPEAYEAFRGAQLNEAEAHCDLAFVYWTQGKLDEARAECRAARDRDSSCSKARDMLALLEQPRPRDKGTGPGRPDGRGSRTGPQMTAEREEAEHDYARRMVQAQGGPIVMPSGSRWMPVNSGPAPAPTDGTITFGSN